jgi:hypothetical protein
MLSKERAVGQLASTSAREEEDFKLMMRDPAKP